jgi:hypothetical protein
MRWCVPKDYHPTPLLRAVQISLLVLIVIGVVMLLSQDYWVPSLVSFIMGFDQ